MPRNAGMDARGYLSAVIIGPGPYPLVGPKSYLRGVPKQPTVISIKKLKTGTIPGLRMMFLWVKQDC